MTRAEALEIYIKTDVKKYCKLYEERIMKEIDCSFTQIVNDLAEQLKIFFEKIAEKQMPVGYIQFSFLLSGMKFGKLWILAEAFPKQWYLGECIYKMNFSMPWLEKELNELYSVLKERSKRFFHKVDMEEVEKIMLTEWKFYQNIEDGILRYAIESFLNTDIIKSVEKERDVYILSGEYRGEFDYVYIYNEDSERMRELFYELLSNQTI